MLKYAIRETYTEYPKHLNWFPGHMRKAVRDLPDQIKKVDLFLEVRDARIPLSSHNPHLDSIIPART